MTQPVPYSLGYSFQGWQISNPNRPLPSDKVESELNRISLTLTQTLANLVLIQRDDTGLANQTVGFDQLKPELFLGVSPPHAWATLTAYNKSDTVIVMGVLYRATVANTSGAFATDLANGEWELLADLRSAGGVTLVGDVTGSGSATVTTTISAGVVSLAKMANLAANSIIGNNTGSPGVPLALTAAQVKAILAITSGDVSGLAASATTDTTNASNISSGTLSAGRLPALTGDVTTLVGTVATTISANVVSNSKLAQMTANTIKGNNTGGTASAADLTVAQVKTLLAITLTSDVVGALQAAQFPAMTGDVTSIAGALATTISAGAVSLTKMASLAANSIVGNNTGAGATPIALTVAQVKTLLAISLTSDVSGVLQAAQEPAHTGDVTNSAGSLALTIAAGAVSLAKMTNLAANSIIGNNTGVGATPIALTVAQVKTLLAITLSSDVIGTLQAAQFPAMTGDVTSVAGALATTISAGAVSLTKMASLAANSIVGNNTGAGATPIALSVAQVKTLLAITLTSDVVGTLQAAQEPAHTGDVTNSAGSLALTIAAGSVSLAKMTNLAANSIIGNNTGVGATPIALSVAQVKTLLAITLTSDVVGTLQAAQFPAMTGDVTSVAGALATTIAAGAVSLAKMSSLAANSIIGNNTGVGATPIALTAAQVKTLLAISLTSDVSGTLQAAQEPAHTGDVTNSAGSLALTIAAGAVSLAKMTNLAANSIIGNNTGVGATPIALTVAQVKTLLAITLTSDVVGTLQAAQEPAHTGDVTNSAGSLAMAIAAGAVSLAKMANLAANSIIGNNTGVGATPIALTAAQVKTLLAITLTSDVVGTLQAAQFPALTGDITTSAGALATAIAANAVTNAKAAQMAAHTIKANITGSTANVVDSSLTAILDAEIGSTQGLFLIRKGTGWGAIGPGTTNQVPTSQGAGADPIMSTPAGGAGSPGGSNAQIQYNSTGTFAGFTMSGDATVVTSTGVATIAANAVTNAKAAQMATNTIKGNNTGGTANAVDLTVAQVKTLLAISVATDVTGTLAIGNGGTGLTSSGSAGNTLISTGSVWASGAPALPVRQTVAMGPDTAGAPSFLPATSVNLNLTSQNVTSSAPLVVTAAQGANASGLLNNTSISTGNLTWTALTVSSTVYLYVNASTGATGFTTLLPIYQYGGAPAVTNGQFTFNIATMTGFMGNGSTAPATPIVFVGEVTTSGSAVTATIAYAYNGFYDSGFTATLPAAASVNAKNHNIGTDLVTSYFICQNTTTEVGYAVGENATLTENSVSAGLWPVNLSTTRLIVNRTVGSSSVGFVLSKSAGTSFSVTAANWKWKYTVRRGWGGA